MVNAFTALIWVQSLVWELRSYIKPLLTLAKNNKKPRLFSFWLKWVGGRAGPR